MYRRNGRNQAGKLKKDGKVFRSLPPEGHAGHPSDTKTKKKPVQLTFFSLCDLKKGIRTAILQDRRICASTFRRNTPPVRTKQFPLKQETP